MARSEEHAPERQRRDRFGIVARLNQRREPLLAQPLEFVFREGRAQRHVGHDRQRIGQPCDRYVQPHGRRIRARRRAEIGAEVIDRIGDLERRSRAGAFLQQVAAPS